MRESKKGAAEAGRRPDDASDRVLLALFEINSQIKALRADLGRRNIDPAVAEVALALTAVCGVLATQSTDLVRALALPIFGVSAIAAMYLFTLLVMEECPDTFALEDGRAAFGGVERLLTLWWRLMPRLGAVSSTHQLKAWALITLLLAFASICIILLLWQAQQLWAGAATRLLQSLNRPVLTGL